MDHYLAPEVFVAVRREDLLILDVAAGEYACVPEVAGEVELDPGSNLVRIKDPALTEALQGLGALWPDGRLQAREAPPAPPRRDLTGDGGRLDAAGLLRMGGAGLDLLSGYWRRPFAELIAGARSSPARTRRSGDGPELQAAVLAFRRLLPFVPFQGECLFRAYMLRAYLARAGLSADWVFGCQTWPFEAHCWLQSGDLALSDCADHLAGFTPIFAVRT